jgi:hypothetical protein
MARYDELPVYKASYDLLVEIFQFTKNFNREFKYTVGESLKNETLALITLIYRANSRKDKFQVLQEARERIEVIRLFIRLLKDLKQINLKKFVLINKQVENVPEANKAWNKLKNHFAVNGKSYSGLSIDVTKTFSTILKTINWESLID